jgi:hypothetical protein
MYVFVDESGTFTGYHQRSISVVGALAIPDGNWPRLKKKYARIRKGLPTDEGQVKGRLLSAAEINRVVRLVKNRDAIFEVTAVDLGLHTAEGVAAYQQRLATEMLERVPTFREPIRERVATAANYIPQISAQLFLQALTTFELMHRVIGHTAFYFSQRKPYALADFKWMVDGKNPDNVTKWESWLEFYATGALATLSARNPAPRPEEREGVLFDYTYFDEVHTREIGGQQGIDPARLLRSVTFSPNIDVGLELVDILSNAIRRTLRGELDRIGWINIRKLMIDRNETYIKFVIYGPGPDVELPAAYGTTVNEGFHSGGRPVFTRRNRAYLD